MTFTNRVIGLSTDDKQPIQIQANNGIANHKTMVTTISGDVVITRGSIIIHANSGIVSQDEQNNKLLTLIGSPVTFSQKQDDGNIVNGQANEFKYDTKTNIATLNKRAKIQKGKDLISGEQITYNTKTLEYSASGQAQNGISKQNSGRVNIILNELENKKDAKQ